LLKKKQQITLVDYLFCCTRYAERLV